MHTERLRAAAAKIREEWPLPTPDPAPATGDATLTVHHRAVADLLDALAYDRELAQRSVTHFDGPAAALADLYLNAAPCGRCDGAGLIVYASAHPDDRWADMSEPCPACTPNTTPASIPA